MSNRTSALLPLLILPLLAGCAAWNAWRAGGRAAEPRPAASCLCPSIEGLALGETRRVSFDVTVVSPTTDGFDGCCPDAGCECPPLHVRVGSAREVRKGEVVHVEGTLSQTDHGLVVAEGGQAAPKIARPLGAAR